MWQWDARHSLRGLLLNAQLLAQTPALCCCTSHLSQSLHRIVSLPFNLCLFVLLSTVPSSFSTYLRLSFSLWLFVSPSLSFSFKVSLFCLLPLSHLIFSLIFIGGLSAKGFLLWFYFIGLSKADQDNVILPLQYTRIGRISAGGKIAHFRKWVGGESGLNLCLVFLLRQQFLWPWYKGSMSIISCWPKGLN